MRLILIWYFVGLAGFFYWWSKGIDFDKLKREDYYWVLQTVVLIGLVMGVLGIFTWILGYLNEKK